MMGGKEWLIIENIHNVLDLGKLRSMEEIHDISGHPPLSQRYQYPLSHRYTGFKLFWNLVV
jgi:hypothetical protein